MWFSYLLPTSNGAHTIRCVHASMFAQTTHCVQIRDRSFCGDDTGLLGLMPANISPGAISFAIKCMMEGGWSVLSEALAQW